MLLELLLALTPATVTDPLDSAMNFEGVVLLDINNGEQYCTGSLLSSGRHILTAARCVAVDPQSIEVVFHLPKVQGRDAEENNAESEKPSTDSAQCSIRLESQDAQLAALGRQSVVWCVRRTYFPHQDFTAENQKMLVFEPDGTIQIRSLEAACPTRPSPELQPGPVPFPEAIDGTIDPEALDAADPSGEGFPIPILQSDSALSEDTEPETAPLEDAEPETAVSDEVNIPLQQCTQPSDANAFIRFLGGDIALLELVAIAPAGADRYPIYRHSPVPDTFMPNLFLPELQELAATDERGQDFLRVGYGLPPDGEFTTAPGWGKRLGANRYDVYLEELNAAEAQMTDALRQFESAAANPPPEGLAALLGAETLGLLRARAACPIPVTIAPTVGDRLAFKTLAYDVDDGSRTNDIFGRAFCLYDGGISGYVLDPRLDWRIPEAGLREGEEGSPAFIQGKIAGVASQRMAFPNLGTPADEAESEAEDAAGSEAETIEPNTINRNVGEGFIDVRVSAYADFIDAVLTPESGQRLPDQR